MLGHVGTRALLPRRLAHHRPRLLGLTYLRLVSVCGRRRSSCVCPGTDTRLLTRGAGCQRVFVLCVPWPSWVAAFGPPVVVVSGVAPSHPLRLLGSLGSAGFWFLVKLGSFSASMSSDISSAPTFSGTPGPCGTVCLLVVGPPRSFPLKTSRFRFGDFLSPGLHVPSSHVPCLVSRKS